MDFDELIGCESSAADDSVEEVFRDKDAASEGMAHTLLDLRRLPAVAGEVIDVIDKLAGCRAGVPQLSGVSGHTMP